MSDPSGDIRLLFACPSCADDECFRCVHLTVGAFCGHFCWWLISGGEQAARDVARLHQGKGEP